MSGRHPWYLHAILLFPERIEANLEKVEAAGRIDAVPNLWQLSLGVLRMWHRVLFRSETIGQSKHHAPRSSWRARLLEYRPLRFPFLLREGAVAPLDLTGLASSTETLIRHLIGAHHDGQQFIFDLEILSSYPGGMEELHRRAKRVVEVDDARSRWLRDLTVFTGYHENLLARVEEVLKKGVELSEEEAADPDLSFRANMAWCAAQPATPEETLAALREGRFRLPEGLLELGEVASEGGRAAYA